MKTQVFTLLILILAVLISSCESLAQQNTNGSAEEAVFTLQLLHFADVDGNEVTALNAVENFSALVQEFASTVQYPTIVLSSGDNIIPGPRFYAAEQNAIRTLTGSNEPGHADIAFLNAFGVRASALGNHELDVGPGELVDAMSSEERNGVVFPGAQFPILAANVNFANESDTSELIGQNGDSVENLAGKFAAYAIANINGERIGLVGATTPNLSRITSVGGLEVLPGNSEWTVEELAAEIQPSVDALGELGVNKIILLSHMQQIAIEKQLARELQGVDIIVAGGSNTRMGDENDSLYPGDEAFDEGYPFIESDASGSPVLVVNVDGDYKYLGRLVVSFSANGTVVLSELNSLVNGSWASINEIVNSINADPIPEVAALRSEIDSVIESQFGNVVGYTNVYLNGRRAQVRTMATNLGNLSADANLWYANELSSEDVHLSIKNGGGIRTEIGSAIIPPGSTDASETIFMPPAANPEIGTDSGAISEGHLRATFRFDNGLVLLEATAAELKAILEHGVAATEAGATPGRFPQIAGMTLEFNANNAAGNRITNLTVTGLNNAINDTVVANGDIQGDADRIFRLVTLNFLANGGDSYPFTELTNPNRINLYEGTGFGEDIDYPDAILTNDPGRNNSFSYTGGEQDAFAEYLQEFHASTTTAYSESSNLGRIQY